MATKVIKLKGCILSFKKTDLTPYVTRSVEDNPEYTHVLLDSDGRIISASTDGTTPTDSTSLTDTNKAQSISSTDGSTSMPLSDVLIAYHTQYNV